MSKRWKVCWTTGLVLGLISSAEVTACVVPDNGTGTATLPPAGCAYVNTNGQLEIVGGLPAGTTIQIDAILQNFVCGSPSCSAGLPLGACEGPGGLLGGNAQCFQAGLELHMMGTGTLAGFNRVITIPVDAESHSAPRTPGDPIQSFDTDMFQLQGQIFGDPDFDQLQIKAGDNLGLPSPGQTTLTRLGPPGSDFQVDSFFDITYQIDFQGAPGSVLDGMGGPTTATVRLRTGGSIVEACCTPNGSCGEVSVGTCVPNGGFIPPGGVCLGDNDGNGIDDACEPDQTEDCCMTDGTCTAVPVGLCLELGGFLPPGGACLGDNDGNGIDDGCEQTADEDCCLPDGTCGPVPAGTCTAMGGFIPAGGFCIGDLDGNGIDDACETGQTEDCCLPDGTCAPVAVGTCAALGGFLPPGGVCLGDGNLNGIDDACEPFDTEDCCLPDGTCGPVPLGSCVAMGGFIPNGGFCIGDADSNGIDDACENGGGPGFEIEFSLDIGSDKELSDPQLDGDEGFDPGDVYLWMSGPVTLPAVPGGRDGFKDDAFIFGTDPFPDPPDLMIPPATAVPVGFGDPSFYNDFFDLDGHDQLDFNLQQFIDPAMPLEVPIFEDSVGGSFCVYPPEFMMISYDDDKAPGWPVADVPVFAPSPAGISSYGSTAGRDEVISLNFFLTIPPMTIASTYPLVPEDMIHADLAPNPDAVGDPEDDDVDSLDIVESPDLCSFWYFTADHEASLGLDPGSIYLATGGIPTLVIDQVIHLGLIDDPATGIIEDADVDAFEFSWMPTAGAPPSLVVIFSVDEDDPLTPGVDESGGLDPNMLYASFMTGSYTPIMTAAERLADDVDALTIWREEPTALLPDCVDADVNCDGAVDAGDLLVVRGGANWQKPTSSAAVPRSDVNKDGAVDAGDLLVIRGGAVWQTSTGPCHCP